MKILIDMILLIYLLNMDIYFHHQHLMLNFLVIQKINLYSNILLILYTYFNEIQSIKDLSE